MANANENRARGRAPLRIAMVGAGMISEYHLRGWQNVADAAVVAIVDPDPVRGRQRAAQFAIPAVHSSVEALLAQTTIDALDVASPRETHGPILRLAARHGLATLCQKPFMPSCTRPRRWCASCLKARARWSTRTSASVPTTS
jgi:D-apiose dehydrogenase